MKLIKLITAVVMSFGMMVAQPPGQGGNQDGNQGPPPCYEWLNSNMAHDMNGDGTVDEGDCPGQGGPPQGPPPCDQWLNSDMAHDMNNDGVVDEGDCPGQGPDPFQQAFMTTMQNGGTPDEAFEAVAAVLHQMDVECDDCEMTEEEFQEGKAEAKAAFDAVLANGGTPEEAFHAAMETSSNDGPATCDVCGHEYGGEDDHHGHCRVCDAEMNTDDDWRAHCDENWEHCKPQAGDTCGYVGPSGDECGYVHSGDPDEDHHHCDTCGMPVNSGDEMGAHCDENPGHCGGPPPTCEEVDANGDGSIDRDEARAKFGHDPQGNPDPNFDQRYDEVDANGDGVVDCGEHDAAVAEGENNN